MSGILSLISHSFLLLGLMQNKAAPLYSNYRLCVWIAFTCMWVFFGTTTLLVGLALDPAIREFLLRITEQRTLTISIAAVFFTMASVGIISYARAMYQLQRCAKLSRMMFGNFDVYKL